MFGAFKFKFYWQAHAALKWDERLAKLSGEEGIVVQQDKAGLSDWRPSVGASSRSDGSSPTGLVSFKVIGLGRHMMTDVHFLHLHFLHFISCSKKWCAFEENATCFRHFWHFSLEHFHADRDDVFVCSCQEDATLQVRFPSVSLTAWLPESTLTYIEEREPEAGHDTNWERHENEYGVTQSHRFKRKKTFGSHFVKCPPYHAEVETEHLQFLCSWWFVATCTLSASEAAAVEKSESS